MYAQLGQVNFPKINNQPGTVTEKSTVTIVQGQTLDVLTNLSNQLKEIYARVAGPVPQTEEKDCRPMPSGVLGIATEIRTQALSMQDLAGAILREL